MGSDGTNYLTKFDILTTSYAIEVPQNVEFVTLNAVIPAKASATGIGKHSINLNQTITISLLVTAEDGTTSDTYEISVYRKVPSKNVSLLDLTVIDPKSSNQHLLGLIDLSSHGILFNPNTKTYTFKLDETYINEEIIINILKGYAAQEVSGLVNTPLTLNHGINRYEIFVKAEDGSVTQGKYTIIIEVRYKTNELKTLTVDGKNSLQLKIASI